MERSIYYDNNAFCYTIARNGGTLLVSSDGKYAVSYLGVIFDMNTIRVVDDGITKWDNADLDKLEALADADVEMLQGDMNKEWTPADLTQISNCRDTFIATRACELLAGFIDFITQKAESIAFAKYNLSITDSREIYTGMYNLKFNGEECVAKFFLRDNVESYMNAINKIPEGILAPVRLCDRFLVQTNSVVMNITKYIPEVLSDLSDEEVVAYLPKMKKVMETIHENGVSCIDMHFGNFVKDGDSIYLIDLDGIVDNLSRKQADIEQFDALEKEMLHG